MPRGARSITRLLEHLDCILTDMDMTDACLPAGLNEQAATDTEGDLNIAREAIQERHDQLAEHNRHDCTA